MEASLDADRATPAISLFSGCGGLDLGVRRAGFDIRVAVEKDRDAGATLVLNQLTDEPERLVTRSIVDIPTMELLERARVRPGEVGLVFGGPPCTPFSKAGYWLEYKRKGLDPNAALIEEFARVVVESRPRLVLMENVPGLAPARAANGPFQGLRDRLEASGYQIAWTVLNAADFGIPQLRKRLFMYAALGEAPPAFPVATHGGLSEQRDGSSPDLLPYVTSLDAIGDLERRNDLAEPEEVVAGRFADLLPGVPPGSNYLHYTVERGHPSPQFRWRSRYWTFLLKLDPARPATTIQSHPGPYTGPLHWTNRRLRVGELKRLQGFADDYAVVGSRRSAQTQLGNAVPPPLAQIVAAPLAALASS